MEYKGVKLTREEQETHYYLSAVDDFVFCDTSILKDIHKLEKQNWIKIKEETYPDGTIMAATFKAPRSCLSPRVYNPEKPKKIMTDEHKAKLLGALSQYRKKHE